MPHRSNGTPVLGHFRHLLLVRPVGRGVEGLHRRRRRDGHFGWRRPRHLDAAVVVASPDAPARPEADEERGPEWKMVTC